ncbi:hypothetical protein NDU88_000741 [Pleurodeles waltl]|uniref:Uncharacterized protein n=1 Tax=Pleurodeles waltl TaxID=8319 RepID=A0AAV7S6Y6_PLEWA|nr:hypothetical protein NDU88_000741 [Pleurodeles waltl]
MPTGPRPNTANLDRNRSAAPNALCINAKDASREKMRGGNSAAPPRGFPDRPTTPCYSYCYIILLEDQPHRLSPGGRRPHSGTSGKWKQLQKYFRLMALEKEEEAAGPTASSHPS